MKKNALFIIVGMLMTLNLSAQVTTSSLTGKIVDEKGEALVGAAVKAVHTPTGTSYGTSTNLDGYFTVSNMRVGGPYVITITYVGFQTQTRSNVFLALGAPFLLNVTMKAGGTELAEVVVVSKKDNILNSKRTGAATNIGREQIENAPTISRSLQDFTRFTPQVNGNSFGGANNRFNNITVDGAVNNDVFGLSASGTPGGQAGTQPISLDAIQEIQVVLAPYDVTQGNFTGGGVNAVTRSGSNKFEGSLYTFGRNDNLSGNNVLTSQSQSFFDNQYGFRLGGPIIKNKLFFFVNAEMQRKNATTINNANEAGSAISFGSAQSIAQKALSYNYDAGLIGPLDALTENNKIFTKFDWNVNSKNQLSLRYNYIDAFNDNLIRSSSLFSFGNDAYKFNNTQHVGILELRTKLNDRLSNNLIVGYTRIRDHRTTAGMLFPSITISSIDGFASNSAVLGSERSSVANSLDQDIYEFTDNFKVNANKHTFTFGTHNEFFSFKNLFINNINGSWTYNSVADFINNKPSRVQATYSLDPTNLRPAAQFTAAQLGFYAQDEVQAAEGLKITIGLRVDVPVFGSNPLKNPQIQTDFNGYSTNTTPSGVPLVAPRLGFNYDVLGNRAIQIRGGIGVFNGRVPFVWLSNQFTNSGMLLGTIDNRTPGAFIPDPNGQQAAGPSSTREVDLVANNFKIPQVFRNNLAIDFKLPFDIVGTLEGIYSKTINSIVYSDLNLKNSTGSISSALTGGADNRPLYGPKVDAANFTNVLLLSNASKGYTYSLTAQFQKSFSNGISAMFAYTNSKAQSINDGASSTALSNWNGVFASQVNGPNSSVLTTSLFQLRHRLVGAFSYKIDYGRNKLFGTGISIFYSGNSGQPYSYVYNGDINGDGGRSNDLIYIPRTANDIKLVATSTATAAGQWTALDNFITNDSYLNSRRGQYAARNGAETPWTHQFDIRFTQDIGVIIKGVKNKIQLTYDIINVGNMINKDWGRHYMVPSQSLSLINYTGSGYTFQAPVSTYQIDPVLSAWSSQLGIRYIF
ncbi:MAG: TonB-dependent receptor [Pedobacter sp.]|nr:MAG: TonB-dependent receptor [Pedobacter sp.]